MTALATTLQAFFTDRLVRQRQVSPHTLAAYRDTLRLLLVVNATAKMHRLAGAKIHQRCWQEGPRTGGLFFRHQG